MQRILLAIDLSDATPGVIDLAHQLAKGLDAEIHLVHVKELSAAAAPETLGYGMAGMPELAPMSGVPLHVFAPMPQSVPENEARSRSLHNGRKKSRKPGSKSHCMSRLAPLLKKF
jgi:nucleotide-binding universal stress UspA family protein